MSPAGSAAASYRAVRLGPYITGPLLLAVLVGLLILISGGKGAARPSQAPVAALSPAWRTFQQDCTAGPAPGQGSTPSACRCWEERLHAVDIFPVEAVDALNAAQASGGAGYAVAQNLVGSSIGEAIAGCLLS